MSNALADTVDTLARPIADEHGLEVLDVDVKGIGGSRVKILVTVDRKGGVDVGTCQKVSKRLARELAEHKPDIERYTLEVSSPGTFRPLVDQRDFDRVEGRTVKITLIDASADRDSADDLDSGDGESEDGDVMTGEVTGTVSRADATAVVIESDDGEIHEVPYTAIAKAVQTVRW